MVNKATLECTVARNELSIHTTVFLNVRVRTDDFSQEVNIIKLAVYVLNRQTARKGAIFFSI